MADEGPLTKYFNQLIRSATRVHFPTGIFGKTCMLVGIVCICCASIVFATGWATANTWWAFSTLIVAILALSLIGGISVMAISKLFKFAEAHPAAAILEGGEFIRHSEIELSVKGQTSIPADRLILTQEPQALPAPEEESEDALPGTNRTDIEQQGGLGHGS